MNPRAREQACVLNTIWRLIGRRAAEIICRTIFFIGEQVTKDFTPRDFPKNAEFSGFGLEVFVVLPDGLEILAKPAVELGSEYGAQYAPGFLKTRKSFFLPDGKRGIGRPGGRCKAGEMPGSLS